MRKEYKIQKPMSIRNKFNRYIYFCSDPTRPDSFFCLYQTTPVARIYQKNNQWYIWYLNECARYKVKNFTAAQNKLEKEIMRRCMA